MKKVAGHAAPGRPTLLSLAATLLLASSAARAEPAHGRLGCIFQVDDGARIGALLCPTDGLCLRPSFRYEWAENDNVAVTGADDLEPPIYETQERYIGVGLDVLWRFRVEEPLAPYVGLSASLTRSNVPYPDFANGTLVIRNGPLTRTDFGALGGLQYAFSRHFALYGEAGLRLTNSDRFDVGGRRLHTRIWGTFRSGIGVALTLK